MALFSLKGITVTYGGAPALNDISLTIEPGEKVALIGRSGAGKTTLLKYLYECKPDYTAFIHQDFALVNQLSVYINIYMGRLNRYSLFRNIRNLVWPAKKDVEDVRQIVSKLQIADKLFEKTGALSGGQQQRTAIGRALFQDAPIVLGDEPLSALDPQNASVVLNTLFASDKTVVLSLHAVELARKCATRILGLRNGQILFDLPRSKVTDQHIRELFQS